MVNLSLGQVFSKIIEFDRVLILFDKDDRLASIVVKDLSEGEYGDLKESLHL